MSPLRRAIRRIPGPLAILLWIALCMGLVYLSLFWVPSSWRWLQRGRWASSRIPVGFRINVATIIGAVSGVLFFADTHGPARVPIGVPRFRIGLWATAMSCWALVPAVERLSGWSASETPLSFVVWFGLALAWTVGFSTLDTTLRA